MMWICWIWEAFAMRAVGVALTVFAFAAPPATAGLPFPLLLEALLPSSSSVATPAKPAREYLRK
jgi:hypothetical protein